MQQRLAQKTAAAIDFSRKILVNTAAGLITAGLLGFWSPALQRVEPLPPQAVGKLNIDPASGKILDRVAIEEEPAVAQVRLKPVLLGYAPPALEPEPGSEAAPQKAKKLTAKPQTAPKGAKPSAPAPESRNMPAESPEPVEAPIPESEGWMSKLAPGAFSAKLAPVAGHLGVYVSGVAAAARRAVADRLEAIGF